MFLEVRFKCMSQYDFCIHGPVIIMVFALGNHQRKYVSYLQGQQEHTASAPHIPESCMERQRVSWRWASSTEASMPCWWAEGLKCLVTSFWCSSFTFAHSLNPAPLGWAWGSLSLWCCSLPAASGTEARWIHWLEGERMTSVSWHLRLHWFGQNDGLDMKDFPGQPAPTLVLFKGLIILESQFLW